MATNKTRIKIRHGSTFPDTGTNGLLPYELGWDGSHVVLYINNSGTIKLINSESTVGRPLVSGDNVDTLPPGIYYSSGKSTSATLNGIKPNGNDSGFRLEVIRGYGYSYGALIAYDSTSSIKIRKNPIYNSDISYSDFTGIPWQTIVTSTNVGSYALPIIGGTLTGNLNVRKTINPWITIRSDSMDDTATSITAETYSTLYFSDKNDKTCSYILCIQSTSGLISTVVAARHRDSDGNNLTNYLNLKQNATSGSASVTVSHPAAWRAGIGAVNIAGDTMTGDLTIQGGTSSSAARINLNRYDGSATGFVGYSRDSTKYGLYINGTSPVSGYLTYIVTSTGRVYYRDSYNTNAVSLAYSLSGLNYADYTYLAGWNGYELRAVAKTQFALASHTHSYLPLAGGTMNDEVRINFPITRKKDGGGGWAYTPIRILDNTSTDFFHIGVYGSANTFNYAYIGSNDYNSTANTRIYADGNIRAGGCAVIRDSGTTNRRIFVTTSASVPSGAATGDIVLVKAS